MYFFAGFIQKVFAFIDILYYMKEFNLWTDKENYTAIDIQGHAARKHLVILNALNHKLHFYSIGSKRELIHLDAFTGS